LSWSLVVGAAIAQVKTENRETRIRKMRVYIIKI
jgi:hypothetical protein